MSKIIKNLNNTNEMDTLQSVREAINTYKEEDLYSKLSLFNKSNIILSNNVEYKVQIVRGRVGTPYANYRKVSPNGYKWLCDLLEQWTAKGVKTTNAIVLQMVEEFNYFYDKDTITKFIDLSIKQRQRYIQEALNSANTLRRGAVERGGSLYQKSTKSSVMGFVRALEICLNDKVTITYTEEQREAIKRAKEEAVAKAKATREAKKSPNKANK